MMIIHGRGWNYHDYQADRIINTEHDSPGELVWADLEDRPTDSEVGGYLTNHDVFDCYRDSERPEECGVTKQSFMKSESRLVKNVDKFGRLRSTKQSEK